MSYSSIAYGCLFIIIISVVLPPVVYGLHYTSVNSVIDTSVSLVCEDTPGVPRSTVEQGIICGRQEDCRGFWGLKANGLVCFCAAEPGRASNLSPEILAELRILTNPVFKTGTQNKYYCVNLK